MATFRRFLLALALLTLSWGSFAQPATLYLKAHLDGAQVPVPTAGDGAGFFTYDMATRTLSWTVTYRKLSSGLLAAHIHGPAPRGSDAPVVVPFSNSASPFVGSATLTPAQQDDMVAGLWYVNVHTFNYPNGEIRGQLSLIGTHSYSMSLDGAQAGTPGSPIPTAGSGSGTMTFDPATMMASWNITYANLGSPVFAAHFHSPAVAFEAAGITLPTGSASPITGSATLGAVQAAELVNGFWYHNVHTSNFTSGEIRGQVLASNPPRLANISTRARVLTGDDVMIGGFIIGGTSSKTVAVVAYGPSLANAGVAGALANPTMTLVRQSDQSVLAVNDDWGSAGNAAQLQNAGLAPSNPLESAVLLILAPGAYTAVVSGVGGGTGVGLVAVYEVDFPEVPLINISTRAKVQTGDDVMIAGFIIQGDGPQEVAIVAYGPSLASAGIANPLSNPTMSVVRASDQAVIATNDDWGTAANSAQLEAAGFAPSHAQESAVLMTLAPGAYTAIVSGVGGGTGIGVVAVYRVN